MEKPIAYLIGLPDSSHPGGSRYTGFRAHLKTVFLSPPLTFRFFRSYWGWRLDNLIARLRGRPYYTLALFLMECRAALHMLLHRKALYHAIKGDVDLTFLPRFSRLTGNFLVASYHEAPNDLKFWQIDRRMTENLAGVILLANSQRPHFEGLLPADRIFVLPHGVDTEFFRPVERHDDQPVCISVGSHKRDAATLTEAMKIVWQANPGVHLIIVGARRPHDPNPPPELDGERVTFLDQIDDQELLDAYHRSSFAVISLKTAVANNALLEAMACGLPVVATDVGGMREYLGEEAGILVPPSDPKALAEGMLQVLAHQTMAKRMATAGRHRALEYDHRVVAGRLGEIYAKVRSDEISDSESILMSKLPSSTAGDT